MGTLQPWESVDGTRLNLAWNASRGCPGTPQNIFAFIRNLLGLLMNIFLNFDRIYAVIQHVDQAPLPAAGQRCTWGVVGLL